MVRGENSTKKLYEKMYSELMAIGEVASAFKIKELIEDVDNELKCAERKLINAKAVDYNLSDILNEQESEHKKYKIKMKEIGVNIC